MNDILTTTIPNWLTAIGTLSAVVLSLFFSFRDRKFSYYSRAAFSTIVSGESYKEKFFSIIIVNTSTRPIKITNIVWKIGVPFQKKHYIQTNDKNDWSDTYPKILEDGEEFSFLIREELFLESFSKIANRNIKLYFSTSSRDEFKIKISRDAYKILRAMKNSV